MTLVAPGWRMRALVLLAGALAATALFPSAAGHLAPGIGGGPCADDGQAHVHLNGFSECASLPRYCLAIPIDPNCTPFVCVYADDIFQVRPWECRSLLPGL